MQCRTAEFRRLMLDRGFDAVSISLSLNYATIIILKFLGGGEMRWQEVQERFPEEWVVLEATKAHSEKGHRYIEEVVVIDTFADSTEALRRYSELHRQEPGREYCFFHTSRPELVARERYVGIRGPR
jgi:hypothetical protein